MFHVYYPSFSFWLLNLCVYVNVLQIQLACKELTKYFVSEKQSLPTVGKATVIQMGIAYTAVQTFNTVNEHAYLLKRKEAKETCILVAL